MARMMQVAVAAQQQLLTRLVAVSVEANVEAARRSIEPSLGNSVDELV